MLKLVKTLSITLFIIALYNIPAVCAASSVPGLKARSAILMDFKTGQVLYENKARLRCAPASTTKIMTAILAVESGRLDEVAKVSPRAASTGGSSMHLYPGQLITIRELLTGLLLRSGNDAAVAIAEYLAGSEAAFVEQMNRKALIIGAGDTHFCNPHGLSTAGHYSSAYDLALMARYALASPLFAEIVGTKETTIDWQDRRGQEKDINLRNTNKLLWMLEEADGVKTGTTSAAGPCLVSSATRANQKLIAVVLHDTSRWYDSMQLLKYGFDNFELYEYASQNDILSSIPVEQGTVDQVQAVVGETAAIAVADKDFAQISVELNLPEIIKAPVYRGQKIGEIIFYKGEVAIKTVDVLAGQDAYSHVINGRFKGGYITRHYGRPGDGVQAVQLELSQCTYMDEVSLDYLPERASAVQAVIGRLLDACLSA